MDKDDAENLTSLCSEDRRQQPVKDQSDEFGLLQPTYRPLRATKSR